jgi:hypothetical protein
VVGETVVEVTVVIMCPVDDTEDETLELLNDETLQLSDEGRLELLLDDAEELD